MISKVEYFFNEITGFSDHPVFIGDLKLGTVVQDTDVNEIGDREPMDKYGHIVGFTRNSAGELNVRVQWDWDGGDIVRSVHPSNLILVIGIVR